MSNKSATETYTLTRSDQPDGVISGKTPVKAADASLVNHSISLLLEHPKLLLPLLGVWSAMLLSISAIWYYFNDKTIFSDQALLAGGIGVICLISLFTCLGNSILLEMLQDYEERKKLGIWRAIFNTVTHNFLNLIVIGIVWGLVWIVMAVIFEIIRSIFRSVFGRLGSLTTDVAEELADHGLEMRVFAMLPAVAWENYNTYGAWIRSSEVLTKTKGLYSDSYWQTLLFGFILGAPLYVIDIYLHANNIETPNPILIFIYLGYAGIAWSLRMYTNQLVVTQLYLCSDALDAARSASPYETITLADIDLPEILSN